MIKPTTQLKDRRKFFADSAGLLFLASVGFLPNDLIAMGDEVWVKKWFETKSLDDTFTVLGVDSPRLDNRVSISAPDTAENGAYVGISVESTLPEVKAVALLIEKNPIVLAGYFEIQQVDKLHLATKVKMAESSDFIALVKSDDGFFMNRRNIKVILGGCGS